MRHSFSLKVLVQSKKKGKEKRNDYSVIEQNALKRQLYGKYFKRFASKNDRQDESLTGRYFEP